MNIVPLTTENQKWFEPVITPQEKELFLKLLDVFVRTIHPYPYLLAAGTLLGALLYEGMIPWDDDLDVYCFYQDYHAIKYLCEASPDLECYDATLTNAKGETYIWLKIWLKEDSKAFNEKYPWKWPFLDVFWMHSREEHYYYNYASALMYPYEVLMPSSTGLFEGKQYSIPHNPRAFVKLKYPLAFQYALSPHWNHKLEDYLEDYPDIWVALNELKARYPVLEKTFLQYYEA
ncbi:MAG: LicD family protein [Cyanobacteria bacterium]|nr:LicD family protein [Cyanobacteriota bacterium]